MTCGECRSKCGYTPQYAAWKNYQELKERNFSVVGFPCNQFGAQEPGTAAEIQSFCSLPMGDLPLAAKIDVAALIAMPSTPG